MCINNIKAVLIEKKVMGHSLSSNEQSISSINNETECLNSSNLK